MPAVLRALKFAVQNFVRNLWLSLVTVIILTLALFIIHLLVGVKVVADESLAAVRSRVDLVVFFDELAPESEVLELKARLEKLPEVAAVRYVSKDEALARFQEQTADEPVIQESLRAVEQNPLPASLVIKPRQLEQYPQILAVVNEPTYEQIVERDSDIESKATFIRKLSRTTQNIARVGFWLSIVFALIAALVIFNAIRITIYTYREEIGIMKLVGASNAFIRAPFIIESVFYAVVASLVALTILWFLLSTIAPFLNRLLEGYDLNLAVYLKVNFFRVFGPPVLLTIVLSMLSSAVAVGRYLKI